MAEIDFAALVRAAKKRRAKNRRRGFVPPPRPEHDPANREREED